MQFIFGYQREVPVKVKRKTSKIALVGLALLVILLLIFLSFENLDGEILTSQSIFDSSVCFPPVDEGISFNDLIEPFFDFSSLVQ